MAFKKTLGCPKTTKLLNAEILSPLALELELYSLTHNLCKM